MSSIAIFVFSGCKSYAGSCTAADVKLLNEQKVSETSAACQDCLTAQAELIKKKCEHVCPSDLVECAKCIFDGGNPIKECA